MAMTLVGIEGCQQLQKINRPSNKCLRSHKSYQLQKKSNIK